MKWTFYIFHIHVLNISNKQNQHTHIRQKLSPQPVWKGWTDFKCQGNEVIYMNDLECGYES